MLEISLVERKYVKIPEELREHFDTLGEETEERTITKNGNNHEATDLIKKMRSNKQPGPEGIKTEMWRWLCDNEEAVEMLIKNLNKIFQKGNVLGNWKTSITILIPKNA